MKLYQTNAALGYKQLAFLIRLDESKNGYNYLCIDTNFGENNMYQIGNVVSDLEDYYLEETTYNITKSPLYNTYLFNYWLSNYFKLTKEFSKNETPNELAFRLGFPPISYM